MFVTVCTNVFFPVGTRWVHGAASLRVLASVWFIASLILATVYRSNLKAMLITPRVQLPFDNLEQLDKSGYPLYTTATSVTHTAIAVSRNGKMWVKEEGKEHECKRTLDGDAHTRLPFSHVTLVTS